MTAEQVTDFLMKVTEDISALRESLKSAHKRIDETDALTAQIHKLAISIETLALQVKTQNDRMEKLFESIESRLKRQGERIGELETKPGKRWETAAEKVLMLAIGSAVTFFITKIGL